MLNGALRVGGTRIAVSFIHALNAAGESVFDIANDYDLTVDQVRLALAYGVSP